MNLDYNLDPPEDPPECPAVMKDGSPCDVPLKWQGAGWVCPFCGWAPVEPIGD
jgi:hypothetical protein